MKKILFIIVFCSIFLLTGCQSYNEKNIKSALNKNYGDLKGYYLTGNLEIYSGDNTYKYKVETSHYDTNYRVRLLNKNNNHEQIILKNNDGVYVLTPSLNKSFKFQSNWPENSSQIYLIESLLSDVEKDSDIKLIDKKTNYIIESKLAYSNNKNFVKEKIYLDDKLNITRVEVFDEDNNLEMKMKFDSIDKKATFNDNYFEVKENMNTKETGTEETFNEIEDTIYPMYLPSGTYLSAEESVMVDEGERVILSFAGESPFIMVQETVNISDDEDSIPVNGEIEFIGGTLGAVSKNSVNFISNGIEYYLSSDCMTKQELLQVAESISPIVVMK